MKKHHYFVTFLIVSIFLLVAPASLSSAESQDDERIVKEVEVVNIVVPVRVFSKGKPVKGLVKKSFTIYENGVKQVINSFQALSRTIQSSAPGDTPKAARQEEKSRYFVLVFNVFDFHENVEKAVDLFFNDIYRKNDKVVIITPERVFNIDNSREMIKSLPVLKKMLTLYSHTAKRDLAQVLRLLELERSHFFEQRDIHRAARRFISNYKHIWTQYATKYLIPDVKKFHGFAEVLRDVKMEKWVIVFQQRELFPHFKGHGSIQQTIAGWLDNNTNTPRSRILQQSLDKLEHVTKVSNNFSLQELQETFFKANATFHVLLFKSLKTANSDDFEYTEAVSDFESTFKGISRATGGNVIFTNKLVESLAKVVKQKDTYYILSYAPKDAHKTNRKIKVKVEGDKKYKAFYIKNLTLNEKKKNEQELAIINVKDFSFEKKHLKLSLVNYWMAKPVDNDQKIGLIDMQVMIVHNASEKVVYNKSNLLKAKNSETNLDIQFDFLEKGNYHVIIDLRDKLSKKSRIFTRQIKI